LAFNKECMSHARECVRLAGLTENKTIRDQLLDMAQRWTAAAQSQRDARVVSLHKLRKQTKPRRRKPSSSGLEKVQKGSAGAKRH
jgi:hypothetical protein